MFIKLTDFSNPEQKIIIDVDKILYMCVCMNTEKTKGTYIKMVNGNSVNVAENEETIISLMKNVKLTFMAQMEE